MLKIGENAGGLYKIASMPFETKEETKTGLKNIGKVQMQKRTEAKEMANGISFANSE